MSENILNYSFIQQLFPKGLQCAKHSFRGWNATVKQTVGPALMRVTFQWGAQAINKKTEVDMVV